MNGPDVQEPAPSQRLTPREEEVLTGIDAGLTNRQIAAELTIVLSTVKWYVRQIYNKLNVSDRAAAIERAQSLGLLAEKKQSAATKHNLPVAATPFVGCEAELAALVVADHLVTGSNQGMEKGRRPALTQTP